MPDGKMNRAFIPEVGEDMYLNNSILSEKCCKELMEMDKHEIIVKISEELGPDPQNIHLAEDIFNNFRFEIARYVIHHEYCKTNGIKSNLLLWLDSKINPANARKLSKFFNKYLK